MGQGIPEGTNPDRVFVHFLHKPSEKLKLQGILGESFPAAVLGRSSKDTFGFP